MQGTLSVLSPAIKPPTRELRTVKLKSGKTIAVEVTTRRLPGAPYYEYSCRCEGVLILQLISNPSIYDLVFAYEKAPTQHATKGKS